MKILILDRKRPLVALSDIQICCKSDQLVYQRGKKKILPTNRCVLLQAHNNWSF